MDAHDVRRQWADRSGEYSPAYYAYYGPDETSERIRETLVELVGRDASVLELGCSSGRHLAHLDDAGFADVAGVEINGDAFDVMAEHYPDLAAEGEFFHGAIESVLPEFDDGAFDAVYSVETLQHVHPETAWVFEEIARITGEFLLTVENEGDADGPEQTVNYVDRELPLYYRNWREIFAEYGLAEVERTVGERDTVRVFRANGD